MAKPLVVNVFGEHQVKLGDGSKSRVKLRRKKVK